MPSGGESMAIAAFETEKPKLKDYSCKITVDTSDAFDKLNQMEEKLDSLQKKMDRLVQTINDCTVPSGSDD